MTSPYARPDLAALDELERVVTHLADELGGWRRRCLKAEAELESVKGKGGMVPGDELVRLRSRLLDLERENLELETRLDRAREMLSRLQQRLAFVAEASGDEGNG